MGLRANETKTVKFKVGFEEFAFYNSELKKIVEPGEFVVYVGDNCTTDNGTIIEIK